MPSTQDKIHFLTRVFGTVTVGADGINAAVKCPSCDNTGGNKKKLVIRLDNDHHHCWVCDLKGRNLGMTLRKYAPQYLQEYSQRFLGKKHIANLAKDDEELLAAVQVPPGFILLSTVYENARDPDVRDTITYARSRDLRLRDFWKFKLGTCTSGRYRRRLIIPSFDAAGKLNYFVARAIDDTKMKYLNAKIPKTDVIFNEINIDWTQELTLVEGPMDLVKCDDNATCLLGSHFSEEYKLFQEIIRHSTPVLLALDPDAMKKSQSFAKMLAYYGNTVRMLDLGKYSDVGEMPRKEFMRAKKSAREWTPNERLFHLINSIKSGSVL